MTIGNLNVKNLNRWFPIIAVASVFAACVFIATGPLIKLNQLLATAVIIDLTISAPFIYLMIIWKREVPKITAVPVFILGLVIASFVIPPEFSTPISYLKTFVLPLIEVGILGFIIIKTRQLSQRIRQYQAGASVDFFDALRAATFSLFENKRVANILSTELAMFYYAFSGFKSTELSENHFSYHKENGSIPLYSVIIFVILAETTILHILLSQWYPTAAWILTGLSIYTGLQLLGHTRATTKRPIIMGNDQLQLRNGLMSQVTIPYDQIEKIELQNTDTELSDKKVVKFSVLGSIESHNIAIQLNELIEIERIYGFRKSADILLLHVDRPNTFKSQFDELRATTTPRN